jgi:NAD-dependent DNA ligase
VQKAGAEANKSPPNEHQHRIMFKSLSRLFAKLVVSHVELHSSAVCQHCGSQLARELDAANEHPREPIAPMPDGSSGVSPQQPDDWHCPNPDCPPQVLQRVALWASPDAMDIVGCDAALVSELVQRGLVRDAAEFYRLKYGEIASLNGMDEVKTRALWDAIAASKNREPWRVLFGLAIPGIGAAEARLLCRHFAALEDLFATGRNELRQLEGVTETMARNVTHWHGDSVNRKLLRRLAKAGVNFKV